MIAGFDYSVSAGLYYYKSRPTRAGKVTYRRFGSAAEAIGFAIEELGPTALQYASLEVDEDRFERDEIRRLYDDPAYPRARKTAAA